LAASEQDIKKGSEISTMHMAKMLGWCKVLEPNTANISGVNCTIYRDPADPAYAAKSTGIGAALARVTGRGFSFPDGIRFYCTNMNGVLSIAFHRNLGGGRQASVLLGESCVDAGNPGMYAGIAHRMAGGGGSDYCAAVIVHELGHNLHERANEGFFWDGAAAGAAEPTASQVSNYATKNRLEFVAEVFTGRMYGLAFPAAVMEAYRGFGGPAANGFP